jgi:phage terminase large subunit-like protein
MEQSSWPPRWLTPVPEEAIARGKDFEPVATFAEAFGLITKDSVAGKSGSPLVLRDWQRSLLEHMFAYENGGYRHQSQLVLMPRKNGKSALGSVIGLYGLILGPSGGEVYSALLLRKSRRALFSVMLAE